MNAHLSHLVDRYVAEKVALGHLTGRSPRTVGSNLRLFLQYLGAHVELEQIRRHHIAGWIGSSSGDPCRPNPSPNTVRSRLSAVRAFLEWCVENEYLLRNPAKGIRGPAAKASQPRFLEAAEVTMLLRHVEGARDRLVVLLMVQMGLRRVEVWRANIEDIDAKARTLAVRGKGYRGEVSRWAHIPTEAWDALLPYLAELGAVAGPLVRSHTDPGRRLSIDVLSKIVADAMHAAGIKAGAYDGRSAHALRHTMAQHLIDDGVPIRVVQKALGHSSVQTTELYTRRDVAGVAEAVEGRRYGGA